MERVHNDMEDEKHDIKDTCSLEEIILAGEKNIKLKNDSDDNKERLPAKFDSKVSNPTSI